MPVLVVRHQAKSDPPLFTVQRLSDGTTSPAVAVPPPNSVPVEGRPNATLMNEVRWYLEKFLDYPFEPELDHAERVKRALKTWGIQTFRALFASDKPRDWYRDIVKTGVKHLTLRIVSDSPVILGWPWEALEDPEGGRLGQQCEIERRVELQGDPDPLKPMPQDRVNILLVIARPMKDDVRYRSISRLLVDLAERDNLPVSIHVLRPPTFDQLRAHLRGHPNHYHILHFDGHGAYRADNPVPGGGNILMVAREGQLLFEKPDGTPDPVAANTLSELLKEHAVPAVVLNACQSAMVDEGAADPFASVAAALLKAGKRSVAAMAYSLYVSGAQQFLPAFYGRLFETGSTAQAVRAGRQEMLAHPERVCSRGTYPLEDWVVPVLYQQDPFDFTFARQAAVPDRKASRLPEQARDDRNPYGFIGRDGPLLELERAMHRAPAGVLISGLGGIGKTTLARGFLKWLDQTNGMAGALWFDFREIRSAEYVLNRLGEALTGQAAFATLEPAQKLEVLANVCQQAPVRIVWDNFESARGIPGTAVSANLSDADAQVLRDLLAHLRGGATKVIITSRSPEDWLGPTNIGQPIGLRGLDGEERWEFANAVVTDLRLSIDRKDPAISGLMDLLRGHPLAMRVVLTQLNRQSAAQLTTALGENFQKLLATTGDEAVAMLHATLRFATEALPAEWQPLCIPLGLHEGYADGDYLEQMAKAADPTITRPMIDGFFGALESAGLVRGLGQSNYELHPLLTSYLGASPELSASPARETWTRAFVDFMGSFADDLAPRPAHEYRIPVHLHGASFHKARSRAASLAMHDDYAALTQALASFAQDARDLKSAEQYYQDLADQQGRLGNEKVAAGAYHQLGTVAQDRRDLDAADRWYQKSLAIEERLGNDHGAASTYGQLGSVAQDRRDLDTADRWYQKALAIFERLGNDHGAATTYHQLGIVAQDRRDLDAADRWYQKALAIKERLGNDHGAASTYGQLGIVAQDRRDLDAADRWYQKTLAIFERLGNDLGTAQAYHQLGNVGILRRDLDAAERWYQKSLAIEERLGNDHGAAHTYHQLGIVAQDRRDLDAADRWYQKALAIKERLGNDHGAATTYHQLGIVAQDRRDLDAADRWYQKALAIKERLGNDHGAASTYGQLGIVAQDRRDLDAADRWYQKALAIFERLGNDHGAALTYAQLGLLTRDRQQWMESWNWLLKASEVFDRLGDHHTLQMVFREITRTYRAADGTARPQLKALGQQAGLPDEFLQSLDASPTEG